MEKSTSFTQTQQKVLAMPPWLANRKSRKRREEYRAKKGEFFGMCLLEVVGVQSWRQVTHKQDVIFSLFEAYLIIAGWSWAAHGGERKEDGDHWSLRVDCLQRSSCTLLGSLLQRLWPESFCATWSDRSSFAYSISPCPLVAILLLVIDGPMQGNLEIQIVSAKYSVVSTIKYIVRTSWSNFVSSLQSFEKTALVKEDTGFWIKWLNYNQYIKNKRIDHPVRCLGTGISITQARPRKQVSKTVEVNPRVQVTFLKAICFIYSIYPKKARSVDNGANVAMT